MVLNRKQTHCLLWFSFSLLLTHRNQWEEKLLFWHVILYIKNVHKVIFHLTSGSSYSCKCMEHSCKEQEVEVNNLCRSIPAWNVLWFYDSTSRLWIKVGVVWRSQKLSAPMRYFSFLFYLCLVFPELNFVMRALSEFKEAGKKPQNNNTKTFFKVPHFHVWTLALLGQ